MTFPGRPKTQPPTCVSRNEIKVIFPLGGVLVQ